MGNNHTKITWKTLNSAIEGTPLSDIPKEILDYYTENDYAKKGIPFSTETFKKIAEILGI